MFAQTLFELKFLHWQSVLLALIPAIATLCTMIYLFLRFPGYKVNRLLIYFLGIFAWQVNDSLSRMSTTIETARTWDRILGIAWMIQFPAFIHYVLLLTGKKKLASSSWFIFLIYLPAFFFASLLSTGLYTQSFSFDPFWGWIKTSDKTNVLQTLVDSWMCLATFLNIFLLGSFAYKNWRSPNTKYGAFLIFFGYSTSALIGMFTQAIFPFLDFSPIPTVSTLMLTICLAIIDMKASKILSLSETIETERITEIIQEIIFVVSPDRVISYINPYGEKKIGCREKQTKFVKDIFCSNSVYLEFEDHVLVPSFRKMSPASFNFSMNDMNNKQVHWGITTYPIINHRSFPGLLVICRDTTDNVLMAEAKLAALRSQMNPHFIFNSLNSIQLYIHNNRKECAESFLSTFSSLMRQILNNSAKSRISISDEIQIMQLYLKLEKARFGARLNYEINIDSSLDLDDTLIPSMLIQPYIENAIIHGLAAKEKDGKIWIDLKEVKESIICTVRDNGIGIEKAEELKGRKVIKNHSYGMSITKARLEILNQHLNVPVSVNITSLFDGENLACGTRVEICIPLQERF